MEKGIDIELIVAMDKNRVIGKNGKMPWHIPEELQSFKNITAARTVGVSFCLIASTISLPTPGHE